MIRHIFKNKSLLFSLSGPVLFAIALLFSESMVLSGICSIAGVLMLFCGGRTAESRKDVILNAALIWFGYSLRFCGVCGSEIIYALIVALVFVPYTLILSLCLALERKLFKAGRFVISVFVMPVMYAIMSYLLAVANLGFISNMMGYAMCVPAVASNLSLLGEYVLTFVLMLVFVSFSYVFTVKKLRARIIFGALAVSLACAVFISGSIIGKKCGDPDYTLNVALSTSQEMDFTGKYGKTYTAEEQLEMFTAALEKASESDADLLVLNEEYFTWYGYNTDARIGEVSEIIREYGIPVLAGLDIVNEDALCVNEAAYFDKDGDVLCMYVKNNLVPVIEGPYYEDGAEEPAVLNVNIGGHNIDLAYIICYDINDDDYLGNIPEGSELLIVPSWDWDTANLEQRRTFIRSADCGLTLLKHSFDGFSHVSTPDGECVSMVDFRGRYEETVTVSVPIWEK